MKKKRMIKLLMSLGCDRNDAARAATLADGNLPHTVVYYDLLEEFIRTYYEQLDSFTLEFLGETDDLVELDLSSLTDSVNLISPAHLRFIIAGLTWERFEAVNMTWAKLENMNMTWERLEESVPIVGMKQ